MKKEKISNNVIRRLPRYLRKLDELIDAGVNRISSTELGELLGFTPSQIRQDFNCFGEFGQQGYGYNVPLLREQIAGILGMAIKQFSSVSVISAALLSITSASGNGVLILFMPLMLIPS